MKKIIGLLIFISFTANADENGAITLLDCREAMAKEDAVVGGDAEIRKTNKVLRLVLSQYDVGANGILVWNYRMALTESDADGKNGRLVIKLEGKDCKLQGAGNTVECNSTNKTSQTTMNTGKVGIGHFATYKNQKFNRPPTLPTIRDAKFICNLTRGSLPR